MLREVNEPDSLASESNIIGDIGDIVSKVGSGNVCYASCERNGVAHFLAGLALSKVGYSSWVDCMPRFLGAFVKADLAKI